MGKIVELTAGIVKLMLGISQFRFDFGKLGFRLGFSLFILRPAGCKLCFSLIQSLAPLFKLLFTFGKLLFPLLQRLFTGTDLLFIRSKLGIQRNPRLFRFNKGILDRKSVV